MAGFTEFSEDQKGVLSHVIDWMNRKPHEHAPYVMFTIVAMSTVVAVSLYRTAYYIMLKSGVKYDIDHRYLGIVKGIFAVVSAYFVGDLDHSALTDVKVKNTWVQTAVFLVSNGYYVHDSIYFTCNRRYYMMNMMLHNPIKITFLRIILIVIYGVRREAPLLNRYYSIDDIINLAHHLITVTVLSYSMVVGKFANLIMFFNWAFEATSVPLHLRYIMRSWRMRKTHPELFTTTELTFIIMYVLQRFGFGLHFSYRILQGDSEVVPFVAKLLCLLINVASFAWYNSIFKLFKRRYGEEFEFLKDFFPV